MEAKVLWNGNLAFQGSAESGFDLPLDAEVGVGGEAEGFLPMELLAAGLAGCTAMDVISILTKKRQDVTSFEVQVHADRAETHPKVFTHAVIEYFVTGHSVNEAAVIRSIELSTTTYCPAQAMLSQVMPIELIYHIYEEQGDGKRLLVTSGIYHSPEQAAT
jgi:putative redox protein